MIKLLTRFFKSTRTTAVLSVGLAIVGWYVVVYSISPLDDKSFSGVTTSISLPSGYNLNIIEQEDVTFDVTIMGMRYNIGNMQSSDVLLYADTSGVLRPGEYDLDILPVVSENSKYDVTSIYPQTIKVSVDRQVSVAFPIEFELTNLSVPDENYLLGDATIFPQSMTVTGPEAEVDLIKRAVVKRNFNQPLVVSEDFISAISLYDADGEKIDTIDDDESSHISTDYSNVKITVPVLQVARLPLTISFINIPDDFPIEEFHYTMSNSTIAVAATEETLDRYYEIPLGHIDVSQLDLLEDSSVTFDVQLPNNMVNYDYTESVIVNFDVGNLEEKRVNVANVILLNVPPNYVVKVMSTAINNVKIIGDNDIIEQINADDVVAEIDFALLDIEVGQYQVPVSIQVLGGDMVWTVGKYQAVINVQTE